MTTLVTSAILCATDTKCGFERNCVKRHDRPRCVHSDRISHRVSRLEEIRIASAKYKESRQTCRMRSRCWVVTGEVAVGATFFG